MELIQLCEFIKPNKNYCDFFYFHFNQGNKIAASALIASSITPVSLLQNPFMNRLVEVGTYNIIQQSFLPIKNNNFENYTLTENPIFRGIFQSNKNIVNIFTQNNLKLNNQETSKLDFQNGFYFTFIGMESFFFVGSVNAKLTSSASLYAFNHFLGASYLSATSSNPASNEAGHLNSVILSQDSLIDIYIGNIGSFVILDCFENMLGDNALKNINFSQTTVQATLNTVAALILAARYIASPDSNHASITTAPAIGAFIAVPFARATMYTAVEICSDLIEIAGDLKISSTNILSSFLFENYLDTWE